MYIKNPIKHLRGSILRRKLMVDKVLNTSLAALTSCEKNKNHFIENATYLFEITPIFFILGLINHVPYSPQNRNHIKDRRFSDFALLYPSAYKHINGDKLVSKSSFKGNRLRRTMPYRLTKQEVVRLEHLRSFKGRPLPPLPSLNKKSKIASEELVPRKFSVREDFNPVSSKSSIYNSERLFTRNISNVQNFKHIKQILVTRQPSNLVNYTSQRNNKISEFRKHLSVIRSKSHGNTANIITRPLRSMSVDDDFLSTLTRRRKKFTRRSKSLDILDENVTINKLYAEIGECSVNISPTSGAVPGYLKLPYDKNSSVLQRNIKAKSNKNLMQKSRTSTSQRPEEPEYAKIDDSPLSAEKEEIPNIQNRPMPIPNEIQSSAKMRKSNKYEHIYQRASIIDAIKEVAILQGSNNYGSMHSKRVARNTRTLSDQLSSFRSLSSTSSGQYAKIIDFD